VRGRTRPAQRDGAAKEPAQRGQRHGERQGHGEAHHALDGEEHDGAAHHEDGPQHHVGGLGDTPRNSPMPYGRITKRQKSRSAAAATQPVMMESTALRSHPCSEASGSRAFHASAARVGSKASQSITP
jgi:hypothetical protein